MRWPGPVPDPRWSSQATRLSVPICHQFPLAFLGAFELTQHPVGPNLALIHVMKTSLLLSSVVSALAAASASGQVLWVNELHYDNAGDDAGEFVEIVADASTDLSKAVLTLYNGNNGAPYGTETALSAFSVGANSAGFTVYHLSFPVNGIQNGAPDGLALSYDGALLQFLSYEGTFSGVGGVANGISSTDIGVSESSATTVGSSLGLIGSGDGYGDFTWSSFTDDSPGAFNAGQTVVPEPHEYAAFAGLGLLGFAAWRRSRRA